MVTLANVDYVIAPYSFHAHLLSQRHGQFNQPYQLLTKEDFLQATSFSIDEKKAYEVLLTYEHLPPSFASLYLSLLTFTPPLHEHPKVQQLQRYYQLLVDHDAIRFPRFSQLKFTNKRVAVFGYLLEDQQLNQRFQAFTMNVEYDALPHVREGLLVDRVETIADEVSLFFNRLLALVDQGVSPQHIILIQPPLEYRYELERQAAYFQVPLALPSEETFLHAPITQAFFNQDHPIDAFIEKEGQRYPLDQQHILQSIFTSMPDSIRHSAYRNEYVRLMANDIRLPATSWNQPIRVGFFGPFNPKMHVFILGFAQGVVPRIHRDTGWLDDNLKCSLGLLTSQQLNAQEECLIRYTLSHTGSLYLSRSQYGPNGKVLASPLVDTMKMKEVDRLYAENNIDYAMELGRIRKRLYEEKWTFYKYEHPFLQSLKQAFPQDESRFNYYPTPVQLPRSQPLTLSYSSINDYFQCGFKYFVSRVLRVEPYDPDEFYMHLGTFSHDVFEHLQGDVSKFSKVFHERLHAQTNLTAKEVVLFRHLKPKLEEVARFNALHQQSMSNPSFIEEMSVSIPIDEHTLLKGVIDRTILLSDDQGKQYVALMDYKSGSESFDGTLMEYGWSLQLPIYALMIHSHPDLKNHELLGVFIQHILNKSMKKNVIEIGKDVFPITYQLDGVVINDPHKASLLDQNILNQPSPFLEATRLGSNGLLKENSHVVSAEYLTSMQSIAKQKILEASHHIRHHNYALNPRKIKSKTSCDYCPFQDVCFRQSHDITFVATKKEEKKNDESN